PDAPSLLTFDRIPAHKQNQKRLELRVTRTSSIVDVVYLDHNNNNNNNNHHQHHNSSSGRSADVATLAVVYENGKAEFWRFQEECGAGGAATAGGWRLLQTSDLCNSPRARVVSVAASSSSSSCGNLIIWCEERPPSESSPTLSVGSSTTTTTTTTTTRNNFRYCICKRAYEVVVGVGEEGEGQGAVTLGGVKIALHNNPCFTVVTSGEYVYLLPAATPPPENPLVVASLSTSQRCLLSWSPQRDTFRVSSTCKGTLLSKKGCPSSPKETDFKRLVTECLGYLSALEPPEIRGFSPAAGGGLLLLLSTGWVTLLQRDGTLRHIYRLPDHNGPSATLLHSSTSFHAYQDTLALARGRSLHLIDLRCGRELHHITLKRDAGAGALLFVNKATERRAAPHLLLETGLYVVRRGRRGWQEDEEEEEEEEENGGSGGVDRPWSESGGRLVESVFEEACKYYQQRSLSSTQLTVDKLRRGGMFQAPISLATILKDYLRGGGGGGGGGRQNAGGELSNGGLPVAGGDDETGAGQNKLLLGSLEAELKALVSLEEVKGTLVRAGGKEVEAICARLVQQEVCRLLGSSELDASALLYLNSLFSRFPPQAWKATQAALQLHHDASGALVSSGAPPEVWKTVLGPGPPTASLAHTNGQPKPKHLHQQQQHHLKAAPVLLPHDSGPRLPAPSLSPVLLPVFELLCLTLLRFQAAWLPAFLELARQKQGSGELSISLASSSWVGGGGGESGERGAPLYKRALAVLHSGQWPERPDHRGCGDQETLLDLEVELLLVSGRPNAVLQALRLLVGRGQWEHVTRVAQRFCSQSPLLNREIFGSLLCEVAQHRDLDPYLELLWALCPDDLTVTGILNLVLKAVPAPNLPPPSSSSSCSSSSSGPRHPAPFPQRPQPPRSSAELTVGLLKPLLRKVLQRETKPSQHYADILQSPVFPPAPPPRQPGLDPAPERQQKPRVAVVASQAASSTDFAPWGSDPTPPPPPPPEHETLGHHGGVVLPFSPFF
ncbi:hypothetical protein CRUP_000175, partial [Coryphaenoides rupestris]